MADQSPQAGEWVLVPREPDGEMTRAGDQHTNCGGECGNRSARATWQAMLAAAPAAPPSASAARIAELEAQLTLRTLEKGRQWDDTQRYRSETFEARARIAALEKALEPFGRNARALSLGKALGHITREDLHRARSLLSTKEGE